MIVSFTGHRSNKIGGYVLPNPTYISICKQTATLLEKLKPEKCISGMAMGMDQYAAFVCVKLGIPFVAATPFIGQEKRWNNETQKQYHWLLERAVEQVIVSPGDYAAWKMQTRNEWMINNSDEVIACWNGSAGGTKNCVDYAKKIGKPIHYLDIQTD